MPKVCSAPVGHQQRRVRLGLVPDRQQDDVAQPDDSDVVALLRHDDRLLRRFVVPQMLRSVSTTATRALSSPTLPAKTMYGIPWASPATGSHSETMPESMVPRHQARRMPSPSVAVSEEVIPPLASTKAGRTWPTTSRTVPTRAALTVRAMARLCTASVPVTSVRLVRITMSL